METKVYGRKPSYKYLRDYMKKFNTSEHEGMISHIETLVYYAIKHDLNEERAQAYFSEQMNHCEKLLKNHSWGIYHYVDYEVFKDIFNIIPENFKLHQYISYNYNYDTNCYEENNVKYSYEYRYKHPDKMYNMIFRDYNEHTVYLYDILEKHGYYNSIIDFYKIYDKEGTNDSVHVSFRRSYNAAGHDCSKERLIRYKEEYANICLSFWHFIKLLDYIEHPNDIDIKKLSERKQNPDEVHDNRYRQIKRINVQKKIQYVNKQKDVKVYRWNPILKCLEEVKDKVKSLLK